MFGIIASIAGPVIGGLIGGKATNDAANIQSDATTRAAQIQADATQKSIAEMARQYDLTRSDQSPYRAAGGNALAQLQMLLGLGKPGTVGGTGTTTTNNGAADALAAQIRKTFPSVGGTTSNEALNWAATQGAQILGDPALATKDLYTPELLDTLRGYVPQAQQLMSQQGGPNGPAVDPSSDPNFGSLNKKFSISDFWNDPVVQASYQSGLDLGTKALKNAAPLTTGLDSGAALKELTKFGTDYTGNMAAGSQNRYVGNQTNDYNRLMGIISGGQTANSVDANAGANAASGIAGATMSGGNNIANLYSSLGNAQGAAKIAGANAWGSGLSSVSNFWNQQQMLNGMRVNNFNSGGYNVNPNSYSTNNGYGPAYP